MPAMAWHQWHLVAFIHPRMAIAASKHSSQASIAIAYYCNTINESAMTLAQHPHNIAPISTFHR
jgi:hypothetical protein